MIWMVLEIFTLGPRLSMCGEVILLKNHGDEPVDIDGRIGKQDQHMFGPFNYHWLVVWNTFYDCP
jgi:hypothetical protein